MTKFLAVVKREYLQRVRTKFFAVMTVLGPVLLVVFTIVPGLLAGYKAGHDTRIAIVDQTDGKLYASIRSSLLKQDRGADDDASAAVAEAMNSNSRDRMQKAGRSFGSFFVEQVYAGGRPLADIKRELNARIGHDELEGYLVIPPDILQNSRSKVTYYGRNVSDEITRKQIEDRLNRAVRRERLIASGVKEQDVEELSKPIGMVTYPVNEKGEEGAEDSGAGFAMVFVVAFVIYITVLLYGQVVLGAIVEEKETRIAEILFSSVRSTTLMLGKLFGVSLLALTQMGIWVLAFGLLSVFGVGWLAAQGVNISGIGLPHLPALFFVYFFLFFMLGYFVFASIYVFIGSMVTTTQEGGQMAMPVVFLLVAALLMASPVIRSPNSSFAFWMSMFPFFSPITMLVRIVSQTPPVWQILLSLTIGVVTVVLLLFLASRIYRIGMLMYGKKASIPEVVRWIKQS
ncbi:MAG: type transport system permease protein [Pyrinomonadaceae bacterium]|jgi:ABC-2 type transport system permease protein|nr:type transport system permease protein [Pyrinomonadaceae bacterium]